MLMIRPLLEPGKMFGGGFAQAPYGIKIDGHDLAPVTKSAKAVIRIAANDPAVIYQHIDAAKMIDHARDSLFKLIQIAEVQGDLDEVFANDAVDMPFRREVDGGNPIPKLQKTLDDRATDTARRRRLQLPHAMFIVPRVYWYYY
jgi:hypothetical protein